MGFCLRSTERASAGLRRIFREQLQAARSCLADDGRLTDNEIHAARKAIKRARTTLRVLRPGLLRVVFGTANTTLRDLALPLSRVRDAKVLIDSLKSLCRDTPASSAMALIERNMQRQRSHLRREISAGAKATADIRAGLGKMEAESRDWQVECDDWELLGSATQTIYRNARRAWKCAHDDCSDELLHEWRKQVKHCWHTLQILAPLDPRRLSRLAERFHRLADRLGDDHDLAMLRIHIMALPAKQRTIEQLFALIDARRNELQRKAFHKGKRLLRHKPKKFARTMNESWRNGRADAGG